jgi:hypothetical protein
VDLVAEEDNRIFPSSNRSQTIIDCLFNEITKQRIEIKLGFTIKKIEPIEDQLRVDFSNNGVKPILFDKIIVATGGSPKSQGLMWLKELGHKIEDPVPSLFTFNMPSEPITKLMGIVVENTLVNLQGSKIKSKGPLLITHWGMSGPAILKLSSYGARTLGDINYKFKIQVNWLNETNNEKIITELLEISRNNSKKTISNTKPFPIPERLWVYLLNKSGVLAERKWGELGKKSINKLVSTFTNDVYQVSGKTTFKDEFVTCGGISLESVDLKTMQSKVCKNLYFAGEVLDIDAITGGYNFQAAWTTGYIAGKLN